MQTSFLLFLEDKFFRLDMTGILVNPYASRKGIHSICVYKPEKRDVLNFVVNYHTNLYSSYLRSNTCKTQNVISFPLFFFFLIYGFSRWLDKGISNVFNHFDKWHLCFEKLLCRMLSWGFISVFYSSILMI